MKDKFKLLLLLFAVSEVLLITKYRSYFGEFLSPVILFFLSLSIGIVPLVFYKKFETKKISNENKNKPYQFLFFALLA